MKQESPPKKSHMKSEMLQIVRGYPKERWLVIYFKLMFNVSFLGIYFKKSVEVNKLDG